MLERMRYCRDCEEHFTRGIDYSHVWCGPSTRALSSAILAPIRDKIRRINESLDKTIVRCAEVIALQRS